MARPEETAVSRMRDWASQEYPEVGATMIGRFADDAKGLLAEYERLRRVEQDHINILRAALYCESGGIDLVNRLATYAISQRTDRQR